MALKILSEVTQDGTGTHVQPVVPMDPSGEVLGGSAAAAQYVQGANYMDASGVKSFGEFTGNVDASTAQGAAQAIAVPATGKAWQRIQGFIRWSAAPSSPVTGTPDAVAVIYWYDGSNWQEPLFWPIKYLDGSEPVDDLQNFSAYFEFPFPARATQFAVGVVGYVGGDFYIDLEAVA